jgi:ABC-type nitrate/sulfonate/bicarbonate transport system ATPase subunit
MFALLNKLMLALDAALRQRIHTNLADLLADDTALYITHDCTIARALADRFAVLHAESIV